ALVDGEFLEGLAIPEANDFETWLAAERALWRAQALEALVQGIAADLARGDAAAAARVGLRAVALDRASESAARAAMRALTLAGDRAAALRVADDLAHALHQTLGAEVSDETARLVARIRDARVGRRVVTAPPDARPRPPLVSRSVELAMLTAAWQRARSGRGQVVIVEGEPGEGKTRLIEELVAHVRLDDASVATARAVPGEQQVEWSALSGLLGVSRGSPESERLDELRARLGRDLEGAVVRVGRFDAAALRELVRWALPRYEADDAERLTRRVERDTGGLPLLAVAMLEAVAGGFAPAPDAPAWPSPNRTLVDSLPGDLPPTIVGVVCRRYRALSEAAQLALGAAAALEDRVDPVRLARATGLDRSSLEQALDTLEWERWLVADARGCVFTAPIERAGLLQEM